MSAVRRTLSSGQFQIDGVILSRGMAAAMLEHRNGPRPIRVAERETLNALRARGLIYFNRNGRPTHSLTTDKGRDLIARLLATQADNLTMAGAEWP